jgi:hypothetical protein
LRGENAAGPREDAKKKELATAGGRTTRRMLGAHATTSNPYPGGPKAARRASARKVGREGARVKDFFGKC